MQISNKEIHLLKIQEKVKNKSILFLEKNKRILFNEKGVDDHVSKAGYGAGAVVIIILVITYLTGSLQNTILPALQSKIMNIFSL
ncbi:hypothetical protein ACWYRQ_21535 [Clostridioides difficile]